MTINTRFFIMFRSRLLRMKNISDEPYRETRNTHFILSNFFFSKIVPFMRSMVKCCWVGQDTDDKWRMRIACWVPKATNTRTVCVILTAFSPQQWLHERALMLRYT